MSDDHQQQQLTSIIIMHRYDSLTYGSYERYRQRSIMMMSRWRCRDEITPTSKNGPAARILAALIQRQDADDGDGVSRDEASDGDVVPIGSTKL